METSSQAEKILVASANEVWRLGVRTVLEAHGRLTICAEAATVPELRQMVQEREPGVLILDESLAGVLLSRLLREVRHLDGRVRVLLVGEPPTVTHLEEVMAAGLHSYVRPIDSVQRFRKVLESCLENEPMLSPPIYRMLQESYGESRKKAQLAGVVFTATEREVLDLLGQGMSAAQIAKQQKRSPKTVESHLCRIKQKVGVSSLEALRRLVRAAH